MNKILSLALIFVFNFNLKADDFKIRSIVIQTPKSFSKTQKSLNLQVRVADTLQKRMKGLMETNQPLKNNTGMLFIFDQEQELRFYMKNTYIDLSIGFFDKDQRLVDIQNMEKAISENQTNFTTYVSRIPSMYALEVNLNWFENNVIPLGSKFSFSKK